MSAARRPPARALAVLASGVLLAGCLAPDPSRDGGTTDGGGQLDAGLADTAVDDAASSGLACTFNRDCPDAERCACDELAGCACERGARGTGVNGVDTCADGNDCQSSLCVEGPAGVYYCSDACDDATDCGPALPLCADIAYLGRICVRQP